MPQLLLKSFPLTEPERNKKQKCQLCSTSFGITVREHLCKRCYRFVCDACAPHKVKTYRADMLQKLHRLCNLCRTQSEILQRYVSSNKLSWGEDSQICRVWLKQLEGVLGQQQSIRKLIRSNLKKKSNSYSTTIKQLWGSFNYSFRQLIGLSIQKNTKLLQMHQQSGKKDKEKNPKAGEYNKILQQTLELLPIAISSINDQNVQAEDVLQIFIFFLAHASADNALILTKYIVKMVSSQISIKNILKFCQILQCKQSQLDKMQNYIQLNSPHIQKVATINYFSAQISIEVVSALILKKDVTEIQKIIAFVVGKRKQFIVKNSNSFDLIQIDLLRNHQGLGDGYKKFAKMVQFKQKNLSKNGDVSIQYDQVSQRQSIKKTKTYENLLKQNQQLRIKNKNQQQQIVRLKAQNNKLIQSQKNLLTELQSKDKWIQLKKKINNGPQDQQYKQQCTTPYDIESSEQSYWECVEEQSNQNQYEQGDRNKNKNKNQDKDQNQQQWPNKKKMRKRKMKGNRPKRMSTKSQKLVKQIEQVNRAQNQPSKQEVYNYQQKLYNKNQQIKKLKKKLQQSKPPNKNKNKDENQDEGTNSQLRQLKGENSKIKQQLMKAKQMNNQLLQKMKQLSNMLMDKEEEQVLESNKSTEEMARVYELEIQDKRNSQQCFIF